MTTAAVEELLQIARHAQGDVDRLGLGVAAMSMVSDSERWVDLYDALVSSESLRSASRKLFIDSHYARAVEAAFKCLNNTVKEISGLGLDGATLMTNVFSPNKPILRLSPSDSQQGYMGIFAGVMTGIRNPRAHDHKLEDEPEMAIEMLALANHLMRKVDKADRA